MTDLEFMPINMERDAQVCVDHYKDSCVAAGISAPRTFSSSAYIDQLRAKCKESDRWFAHVWEDDRIVGDCFLGIYRDDYSLGYINRLYVIPELRGSGIAGRIHQYILDFFAKLEKRGIRLRSYVANGRARNFYIKMGYRVISENDGIELMERIGTQPET